MKNLNQTIPIRLKRIEDLARLASSMISLGHSTYVISFKHNNRYFYGIFMVFRDYYKYYGVPMFYYIVLENPLKGKYILIKVDSDSEIVEIGNGARHGWISIPIVELVKKPPLISVEK